MFIFKFSITTKTQLIEFITKNYCCILAIEINYINENKFTTRLLILKFLKRFTIELNFVNLVKLSYAQFAYIALLNEWILVV